MYKKSYLFAAVMSLAFTVGSAQSNLSNATRAYLESRNSEISTIRTLSLTNKVDAVQNLFAESTIVDGVEKIQAFVKVEDESTLADLENLGVDVNVGFGKGIYTVQIPVDKFDEIEQITKVKNVSVAKMMKLNNDQARSKTNVTAVHAGTDLERAYLGTGVIVGIIDTGIEFNHINFKDSEGVSRVVRAYVPGATTGGAAPVVNGKTLPGRHYTTASQISSLTTDNSSESHGSHTSGIAGGSYSANGFQGMAPASDLVLCGVRSLTDANIANCVAYIIDYAKSVGKPAVVNMSLGGHEGPHDGTSYLCEIFDSLAGDGNVIVMSAGNEGDTQLYFNSKFTNTTDVQAQTIVRNYNGNYNSYSDYIDIWNRAGGTRFGIQFVVLSSSNAVKWESEKLYPSSNTSGTKNSWSGLSTYYGGTLSVSYGMGSNGK